jgi:DNA processing protein
MPHPSEYSAQIHLLALCALGGIEPRAVDLLLRYFGSAEAVLTADTAALMHIDSITEALTAKVKAAARKLPKAADLARLLAEREINLVTMFESAYGTLLRELNDPPPLLFVRGRMPDPDKKSVTLVGASDATSDGIEITTRVAQQFGQAGVQVISSLRGGIDGAAHLGTKAANGVSFAVLDAGVDDIADKDLMPLAIDIVESGGVITEYLPEKQPSTSTMEASNRLLVGLGQAVVITELYASSTHTLDLLSFCRMIGKLTFFIIDPALGALADETSLARAIECGAVPIEGFNHIDDIVRSLV